MQLGAADCNGGKSTGKYFKGKMYFFFPPLQVFSSFDIYSDSTQIFLHCSGFNFGLLSNITDNATPEEMRLVFKLFLLIVDCTFASSAFCRVPPFVCLFVLPTKATG